MTTGNPYEPPTARSDAATSSAHHPFRPPYVWTTILLLIGGFFLLLLNGQVFTNGLVFLGCAATSGVLWLRFIIRSGKTERQRLAFYVLLAHVVFMITFSTGLPEKHRWQQGFNKKVHDAQQRARQTIDNQP